MEFYISAWSVGIRFLLYLWGIEISTGMPITSEIVWFLLYLWGIEIGKGN